MGNKLTKRQMDIYDFMIQEANEKGYPPTVREIGAAIGVKSTSTVYKDIVALEEAGYVIKDPAKPRALKLSHNGPFNFVSNKHNESHISSSKDNNESETTLDTISKNNSNLKAEQRTDAIIDSQFNSNSESSFHAEIVNIPVIGNIAAGSPIIAEQMVEDSFPVPARFIKKSGNFMLKVRGESMIEVGILDGDYILVEQHNMANNGEIVVAMINDYECEATVKTFYKENGHFRLQPENSSMEPIIVDDVTILGKVVGVFRYFN